MGQLDGKVAIVTGGNRGIGKGIARGLAAEGASLTIAARNAELLEETANEFRANGTKVLGCPDRCNGRNTDQSTPLKNRWRNTDAWTSS